MGAPCPHRLRRRRIMVPPLTPSLRSVRAPRWGTLSAREVFFRRRSRWKNGCDLVFRPEGGKLCEAFWGTASPLPPALLVSGRLEMDCGAFWGTASPLPPALLVSGRLEMDCGALWGTASPLAPAVRFLVWLGKDCGALVGDCGPLGSRCSVSGMVGEGLRGSCGGLRVPYMGKGRGRPM